MFSVIRRLRLPVFVQVESVNQECRSLREELDRLRPSATTALPPRAIELQYLYRNEPKRSLSGNGDLKLSRVETTKGKVIDDEYEFHLSPLAEVTAPLMSSAPSLMALADDSDQDEMIKAKRAKSPIQEEPEPESELEDSGGVPRMAFPFPAHLQPPTTKIEPIPIPARTPPSRQSSAMAMSVTADAWPSSFSGSKPREDIVMSSRPPSPIRRFSSDRMTTTAPQGPRANTREMSDLKRRDSTEMPAKDHLVSKLHDLLGSPRPASSLQPQRAAEFPEPALPGPISRLTSTAPSRPSSTAQQVSGSASMSVVHYPGSDDLHGNGNGTGTLPDRKPLVRASDAAMQLEKERLERLEKERRRQRDAVTSTANAVTVTATSAPSRSHSLKDATNVPVDTCHPARHKSKSGGAKSARAYYTTGIAAETYA